jgi:hypothetical protein
MNKLNLKAINSKQNLTIWFDERSHRRQSQNEPANADTPETVIWLLCSELLYISSVGSEPKGRPLKYAKGGG